MSIPSPRVEFWRRHENKKIAKQSYIWNGKEFVFVCRHSEKKRSKNYRKRKGEGSSTMVAESWRGAKCLGEILWKNLDWWNANLDKGAIELLFVGKTLYETLIQRSIKIITIYQFLLTLA